VQDHVNQFDVETSIKRMVVPEKVLQVSRHSKQTSNPIGRHGRQKEMGGNRRNMPSLIECCSLSRC